MYICVCIYICVYIYVCSEFTYSAYFVATGHN